MRCIDLNADIGEAVTPEGQESERAILEYVSSANIACGGHAGNDRTMMQTVSEAIKNNVVIGAHPGYPDPEHFGRKSMDLDDPRLRSMIKSSLVEQIIRLIEISASQGADVAYVKPHGALYNDAVKSRRHAELITDAISEVSSELMFMGGPMSEMTLAAERCGLTFIAEGFIDRTYTDDGHLQSRSLDGAVIKDQERRMAQALSLAVDGTVMTNTGGTLQIDARSLCLHGDSHGATETAKIARETLESAGIEIRSFANGA